MEFDQKTLEQIDYFRIINVVCGFCFSQEGKESLSKRMPLTDSNQIESLKEQAEQWATFINSARKNPLSAWEPIIPLTEILAVSGSTLELEDLANLGCFFKVADNTTQAIVSAAKALPLPRLEQMVCSIPDLSQPAAYVSKVVDKNGQLKDLPQLREIRTQIAKLRREIDGIMKSYAANASLKDSLQSDVPALRANRQVLAVKVGSKNKIRGIIHEVSQTGQTVYIEPDEAVHKNNQLVQEEFRLAAEIRRILKETTQQIAPFRNEITAAANTLIQLDSAFACARWGIETKGIYAAQCNPGQPPALVQGRHPLLGTKAVPIDVVFPEGCRVIIVTGPNTGGKTVTLKTLALFTLLNQSGFPVPAAEGTRLPVCSSVFADIGDEQSLDQSLSTFSGHMKNISDMLRNADKESLVLLDELGSGTDPQEGGAIAMAVLDSLIEKGCIVLVTTHHGVLKNFGYTHPSCMNACAEFDEGTLKPTYRIRAGIPGESRALDIARRNGLPLDVADKAQSYIAGDQADISAMIRGLNAKHEEADQLKQQLLKEQHYIREKRREVDLKELALRQQKLELAQQDNREARKFLVESRKTLENLVRELREGEITQQKTKAVKQYIAQLGQAVENADLLVEQQETELYRDTELTKEKHEEEYTQEKPKPSKEKKRLKNKDALAMAKSIAKDSMQHSPPADFHEGAQIITGNTQRSGTLIRRTGKSTWLVQVGSMKMTIKEKDMSLATSSLPTTPSFSVELDNDSGKSSDSNGMNQSNRPLMELRLLGMRQEQAIKALERQLDLASIHGLNSFSVIHGKGNGVLQQAVHDYLSHYPAVKEFHFALPEDGGTGKTYVQLG